MAGIRFSVLKSLNNSSNFCLKPNYSFQSYNSYTKASKFVDRILRPSNCVLDHKYYTDKSHSYSLRNNFSTVNSSLPSSSLRYWKTLPLISLGHLSNSRFYSSSSSSRADIPGNNGVPAASAGGSEMDIGNSDVGREWIEKVKDVWQSAVDAASFTGQKAKEVSDELSPHVEQLLDSHPYLKNVVVPVSMTLTATLLAWVVMPRLLKRFHKYSMQSPVAILSGSLSAEQIPYEKSFWGALEDPLRYLITFFAFSQIGMMVAPTTIASQYVPQAWRGAVIISFVWFLYRWKTNVFTRALAAQSFSGLGRDKILTLDKLSSVGLFVIGVMAFAEACGVAVQSIVTVGGIGGVATAFAARDILGNVLSGLSMQFSQPFSLGDTIKAGTIEGQVVEMGLMTTSLLSAEKFPIIVPNSLFSSQVIVNKSRAQWRAITHTIPLQVDDLSRLSEISNDIKNMLKAHPKVFLEKEAPYCFLSRIESTYAELTMGCNLVKMSTNELYSAKDDILLRSVNIIKEHGASLGSTASDWTSR